MPPGCDSGDQRPGGPGYDDHRQLAGGFGGTVLARTEGQEAEALVRTLASLVPAEQMRCHIPVYGYRIHDRNGAWLDIAICFRCNNARTTGGGEVSWFTFDGRSSTARALLAQLAAADPASDAAQLDDPDR